MNTPEGGTFGQDVREVRRARKISGQGLAHATGYSPSYVSKVESGTVIPHPRFASGCDKAFGTGDLFTRALRRLTEGEYPSWFAPFMEAEREATRILDYSTVLIFGLLQTPEYARATLRAGRAGGDRDALEAMVTSRMGRREILTGDSPPDVWVVLHEAALRSTIGSSEVMADQLRHILNEMSRFPSLTVQVLPHSAAEAGLATPYTMLHIPESGTVVHVEGPQGSRAYETTDVVANATGYYDDLRANALSPGESANFIAHVRNEHARDAVDQVQLQRPPRGQLHRVGPGSRVRRKRARP